ncbi:MAG: sigma-54-dependent Fis family transcriptional regulator [Deltaproteobacteria bacterium]|nr:sigma-54-dependent Fis family transcriptional regulator [Deltaproteobacteria bacterium]
MQKLRGPILVVDDEVAVAKEHAELISELGYSALVLDDLTQFEHTLRLNPEIELVLLDLNLPGISGEQLLNRLRMLRPDVGAIMVTVVNDLQTAVRTVKSGAFNYLLKPLESSSLQRVLESYFSSVPRPLSEDSRFATFLTSSNKLLPIFERAASFATSDLPVLIEGEAGTGKDILTQIIHACSGRAEANFVQLDLSTLQEDQREADLFGRSEPGYSKSGILTAPVGTIVIKEPGCLSALLQRRLAIVLEEMRVSPASTPASSRTQVILVQTLPAPQIGRGSGIVAALRERLRSQRIVLPPLRERPEDIKFFAQYFLQKYAAQFERTIAGVEPAAMDVLLRHGYAGNVRELENIITAAVLLENGEQLQAASLPNDVLVGANETDFKAWRRDLILRTIAECDGNQTQAARRLRISRATLNRFVKQIRNVSQRPSENQKA